MPPAEQIVSLIDKARAQVQKKFGSASHSSTTTPAASEAASTACPTCLEGSTIWGETPAEGVEPDQASAQATASAQPPGAVPLPQPRQKIGTRCMIRVHCKLVDEEKRNQKTIQAQRKKEQKLAHDALQALLESSKVSTKQKRAWEESERRAEARWQNVRTRNCRRGLKRSRGLETLQRRELY
ncbi:hypothetical protein Slin15195_G064070 [Septoria linicola]|uniref:Uncharacterized protein n=1 Tax=Septoria linicola TaxID=215465 RepID=A0A9Q9EL58_9PEZI|nr:hypothetical protein Slin14017_G114390 [Septoria linicola]USW53088.1 hypothetical protein Slin15195_G064070 [Septoria linicola]